MTDRSDCGCVVGRRSGRLVSPALLVVLAGLVMLGLASCGGGDAVEESPQARYTRENAERMFARPYLSGNDAPAEPGVLASVECSGGEHGNPRGDFRCLAVSDAGVRIECEGFVTRGEVASGGCGFLSRR